MRSLFKALALTFLSSISSTFVTAETNTGHLDVPMFADGKLSSLAELSQGQASLLFFWSVNCSFCKKEMPALNSLYDSYHQDLRFLAINQDQDYKSLTQIKNYIEEYHLQAKVINDPKLYLSSYFKVPGTPTVILLNKEGYIVKKTHSQLNKLAVEIEQVIKDKQD
ncbi:TlpA family protein disulfide reductase [Agaribacterium sp. ZY112]|uniref:TlpA family protein disulfide reductase n=1 Tax=Agaribacterium sp. ZY112 TaxID=3233574 RepID=UPI003523DFF6